MANDPKTIKEDWGVDPIEGVQLNEVQQTIVDEASQKDGLKHLKVLERD